MMRPAISAMHPQPVPLPQQPPVQPPAPKPMYKPPVAPELQSADKEKVSLQFILYYI